MTHLSTFRKESSFTTWVFRIASNYLKDYKKNMFSKYPLSFEYYGEDIEGGKEKDIPDLTQGVEAAILEEELKVSCACRCINVRTWKGRTGYTQAEDFMNKVLEDF